MKQTGELLRQARENAKLSLSEVALSTKINPKILAAIENGDMTHLPAKTFLKGFVRSYALYLKMDADEVMKVFQAETAPQPVAAANADEPRSASEPAPAPTSKARRVRDDESFSGLRAIAVTVIVVLIGVIIGVRELIEKYQREKVIEASTELKVSPLANVEPPRADVKKEEAKTAAADEKKEDSLPPKSLALPKALPVVEVKPAEIKAEEPKKEEPKKEPLKVAEVPQPVPAETKPVAPKPEVKPIEQKPAVPLSAPIVAEPKPETILKTAKNEIILEALDKVEVKFKVHGQPKILSLGPTQVHTIFADEPLILDLSDGGAVNIILNGRERGVPGDLGKPKQVKIP